MVRPGRWGSGRGWNLEALERRIRWRPNRGWMAGRRGQRGGGPALPGRAEAVPVRTRVFPTPAWLRTSVVLLRYPALLAAIVLAAVVLAAASAAAPLFLGSAGSTALRGAVERTSRWEAGLTVAAYGRVGGQGAEGGPSAQELLRRRTDFLRRLTGGVEGLGDEVVTILGTAATVTTPQSPAPGVAPKVQLVARSGFAAHVREVAGGGPAGAWVPRSVAEAIG